MSPWSRSIRAGGRARVPGMVAVSIAVLVLALVIPVAAPPALAGDAVAAIAQGGRLYDNWRVELNLRDRRISHLPEPEILGATATSAGRCVTCHGWDYQGQYGRSGGLVDGIAAAAGGDPEAVLAVLGDRIHGYGQELRGEDLRNLALFVTRGQVNMDDWIDPASRRAHGDPGQGSIYFHSICAGCHGADGMTVASIPPLGDFSRDEPWHALHVILNGHPNGSMPPLRALEHARLADTLAYMQTLPSRPAIAAIVHGGRLYDTWYTENGLPVPEGWHPAYPKAARDAVAGDTEASRARAQRYSWRCVACHGWDYKGRDGVARTEHPVPHIGIDGMAGMFPKRVEGILTDDTHDYDRLLTARDIEDLAMFVSRGQIDMSQWIDPETGAFRGDAAAHAAYYQTVCATCHGLDGRGVRTMPPLGRMVTHDPERALHNVFNGHAGDDMPPLRAMGVDLAAGILAYAATLPRRK